MSEFLIVITAVLPVFCTVAAGVVMREINWLTEEADQSLLRININVLIPALIFDSILNNQAVKDPGNVILAPLVGFGTVALGMALARGIGFRLAGLKDQTMIGTFALCIGLYNYGYVPVPLAQEIFDRETVGVLFVHNLGVEVALWTLGMVLVSGGGVTQAWKRMFNAPVVAIIAALVLNLSGMDKHLPRFLLLTASLLGQAAIPLALILIGATMADHLHEFHVAFGWRVISAATVLRLAVLPVLFLLLAKYLPASVELKRVIVIQSAMPAAVFPIIMARHYGGHAPTALRVVVGTSALSLLTIPLWIRAGLAFVF